MFKLHAMITFLVPLLALAVPLADTTFAFFRRIIHGQSPFHADKGHFHHRLLALGLNQKQAVAVLYGVSAVLGLIAVLLAGPGALVRTVLRRLRVHYRARGLALRFLAQPEPASSSGRQQNRAEITEQK